MKFRLIKLIVSVVLLATTFSHAGYRETFEKEFMLADWAGQQAERSACVECHSSEDMDQEMHALVRDWQNSWHAANEVSCHDCHGGAPEDASMSMSHDRGFQGSPERTKIPVFCGSCHVGIMHNYNESGHGQNFCVTPDGGPNCVTCHGSHDIQQASIDIINEQRCSQCHTYERAELMKQALSVVENKLTTIQKDLKQLKMAGIPLEEQEKAFFRTHSEFRTIFHTIDVELVKERTSEFTEKLAVIEAEIKNANNQLVFRKNFSAFLLLVFAGMAVIVFLLIKSDKL